MILIINPQDADRHLLQLFNELNSLPPGQIFFNATMIVDMSDQSKYVWAIPNQGIGPSITKHTDVLSFEKAVSLGIQPENMVLITPISFSPKDDDRRMSKLRFDYYLEKGINRVHCGTPSGDVVVPEGITLTNAEDAFLIKISIAFDECFNDHLFWDNSGKKEKSIVNSLESL